MRSLGLSTSSGGGGIGGFLAGLFGGAGAGGATQYSTLAATPFGGTNLIDIPYGGATGADWIVGGSGGTDSRIAQFKVTPGERIIVQTPQQQESAVGVTNIYQLHQHLPATYAKPTQDQAAADGARWLRRSWRSS